MKVAIINDSRSATEVLRRILATRPQFQLLWSASSGEEGLRLASLKQPDIVLMDLVMPGMDGAETTKRLMQSTPCVVLIVTATTVGNRNLVFEAMGHGALDAVNTPTLGIQGDMAGARPLLQKLQTVARLVVPKPDKVKLSTLGTAVVHPPHEGLFPALVAIGASTGGPQALATVLSHLPADLPAAVLIAQHVDHLFAPALAEWLQQHCALPVKVAADKEAVMPRGVWLAGSDDHMICGPDGRIRYTQHPRNTAYRPSADVLFTSMIDAPARLRVGVLLTGMGRDGAVGLLGLRNAGGLTLAQDASSSVVYGMPKAAAELKAATEILPLAEIGPRILAAVNAESATTKSIRHATSLR
jgi:two-component system response regulator WspF